MGPTARSLPLSSQDHRLHCSGRPVERPREDAGRTASSFPNAPPPPAPRGPLAHPPRIRESAALELRVDPLHQAAQIRPGSCGQVPQGHFQVVSTVLDLDAGILVRALQVTPRLPEGPLEAAESHSDGVGPQMIGLNTPHRCPSSSRYGRNPADRRILGGPPPLGADGLRAPTRHCPFGSEPCRHPATAGRAAGLVRDRVRRHHEGISTAARERGRHDLAQAARREQLPPADARKAKPQPTAPPVAESAPAPRKPREVRVSQSVRTVSAGLPTLGRRRQENPRQVCAHASSEIGSRAWRTRVRQDRWGSGSPPGPTWRLLRSESRDPHRPPPSPCTQPECTPLLVRKALALRDPLRPQVQRAHLHRRRTTVQAAPTAQGPPDGCDLLVRPTPAGPLCGRVVRDGGTPGAAAAANPGRRSPAAGELHRKRARARCTGHDGHRAGASSAQLALARIAAVTHRS